MYKYSRSRATLQVGGKLLVLGVLWSRAHTLSYKTLPLSLNLISLWRSARVAHSSSSSTCFASLEWIIGGSLNVLGHWNLHIKKAKMNLLDKRGYARIYCVYRLFSILYINGETEFSPYRTITKKKRGRRSYDCGSHIVKKRDRERALEPLWVDWIGLINQRLLICV